MGQLMTYGEAAKYLRMNKRSLQRLVSKKKITCLRYSATMVRFRQSDLDEWLKSRVVKGKL